MEKEREMTEGEKEIAKGLDNFFEECNPFYDNHYFTKADTKRHMIKWYECPLLWVLPMKVQITEDGVFYFKVWNGAYYLIKYELSPTNFD